AVNGLQIGVVGEFEEDPAEELRVKIILPGIDPEEGFVWARLASPEAGLDRGYFFRPEPGDEVVVGFFNDDPRQAVILGGLYSSVNTAPEALAELSEDNINKGIVTKSGTTIQFVDDEKASLIIQTVSENKIVLSDDEELIELSDQHGNSVKLSADGIEIVSAGDLKIEAGGNVEITGEQVDVK
ncbi:MAG: Rhs element Vgr protein, partial [Gammaproteobacteria bacterium]|nr:Rhs element Vgr protein [Gammaproteobacteria bacterium]